MKKVMTVVSAFAAFVSVFAAQVNRVLVRQQWPWNADVRIEYDVSGLSNPAEVTFKFFDNEKEISVSDMNAIKGDRLYAKNGINVATFNPKELFGPAAPAQFTAFTAQVIIGEENAKMGDKLYRIVDLDTGKVEDITRGDFYNGKYGAFVTDYKAINSGFSTEVEGDVCIWTDVTNNVAYRTSKMVLRKIPAANVEWIMGQSGVGAGMPSSPHLVKLTKDYYIGVFPVTQMQYFKLMGNYGRAYTDDKYENHEEFPIYGISYNDWRGKKVYWTVDGSNVEEGTYLDVLRKKCGGTILFDMPTEAQWDFACRGRNYENQLYTGKSWAKGSITEISWNNQNANGQPHIVGRKYPNVYGLYDMTGNMWEWCLDFAKADTDYEWKSMTEPEVNPKGILKSIVAEMHCIFKEELLLIHLIHIAILHIVKL